MINNLNDNKENLESNTQSDWKKQLVEVIFFFFFFILTSLVLSFFVIKQHGLTFVAVVSSVILHNLALVGLVVFFTWRNGESASSIGWTFENIREDVKLGFWLFIPFFLGISLFAGVLQAAGLSAPSTLPSFLIPSGIEEIALAFVLIVVVALSEETIFRGYLIRRFKAVSGNLTAAVLLSSVIFSLGHGYEGSAGIVLTGIMGLIFALAYIWRQSLVIPVVMHFLQNFVGIALSVLLKMK